MAGALSRMVGDSRRAVATSGLARVQPIENTGRTGALSRIASQETKAPRQAAPMRQNHMVNSADQSISANGNNMRQLIGRIASRGRVAAAKGGKVKSGRAALKFFQNMDDANLKTQLRSAQATARSAKEYNDQDMLEVSEKMISQIKREMEFRKTQKSNIPPGPIKRAEGGKVGTAMSALRNLAKRYQSALEAGDKVLARRLKRELELAKMADPNRAAEEEIGNRKAATFAKGGKVAALKALTERGRRRITRKLLEIEARMAWGETDPKTGRVKGETPAQAAAREEYDRVSAEAEKKGYIQTNDD